MSTISASRRAIADDVEPRVQPMNFDEWIRTTRTDLGLSQEEFATRLSVARQTIVGWESGTYVPYASKLPAIQAKLDLSKPQAEHMRTAWQSSSRTVHSRATPVSSTAGDPTLQQVLDRQFSPDVREVWIVGQSIVESDDALATNVFKRIREASKPFSYFLGDTSSKSRLEKLWAGCARAGTPRDLVQFCGLDPAIASLGGIGISVSIHFPRHCGEIEAFLRVHRSEPALESRCVPVPFSQILPLYNSLVMSRQPGVQIR